jgi:hypothetical protein
MRSNSLVQSLRRIGQLIDQVLEITMEACAILIVLLDGI